MTQKSDDDINVTLHAKRCIRPFEPRCQKDAVFFQKKDTKKTPSIVKKDTKKTTSIVQKDAQKDAKNANKRRKRHHLFKSENENTMDQKHNS